MGALRDWYDRLTAAGQQFSKGVAIGAGIPTSTTQAKALAQTLLGTMFGIPDVYSDVGKGLGQSVEAASSAISHPIQTATSIVSAIKANPAGSAGVALGMAAPMGPDELHLAKLFGREQLSNAERRMIARVATERARTAAEQASLLGEGAITKGPLNLGPKSIFGDIESFGDEVAQLRSIPDKALQASFRQLRSDPNFIGSDYDKAMLREFTRRGIKPDISAELSRLHEGPAAVLPPTEQPWTREGRGGKMIPYSVQEAAKTLNIGSDTHVFDAYQLTNKFPDAQLGKTVAWEGSRWVKDIRGSWTRLGPASEKGRPINQQDIMHIFQKHFDPASSDMPTEEGGLMDMLFGSPNTQAPNVEAAISEVARHVGLEPAQAERATALHIWMRMKAKVASPQEATWYNLYKMRPK